MRSLGIGWLIYCLRQAISKPIDPFERVRQSEIETLFGTEVSVSQHSFLCSRLLLSGYRQKPEQRRMSMCAPNY